MNKSNNLIKKAQIKGIIIPAKWNNNGEITGVTVQTNDEKIYIVEPNKKGKELLNYIRKEAAVQGKIRKRLDGHLHINVRSYEIIAEALINYLSRVI